MKNSLRQALTQWGQKNTNVAIWVRYLRTLIRQQQRQGSRVANVAMLHAGRCGSSVLADMLHQHSMLHWRGEPFEKMTAGYYGMNARYRAKCRLSEEMWRWDVPYYGFDLKYLPEQHLRPELANLSPKACVKLLQRLGTTHYILLNRRNHLRRAVSATIGRSTGQWAAVSEKPKATSVHLDPNAFISYGKSMSLKEYFSSLDQRYLELTRLLAGQKVLELVYETDIQQAPQVAYEKSCHFLGLAPETVDVRLRKQNIKPLNELILNFSEIEEYFTATEHEWMLSE
jgi:LPS sulfotransferase NodH